MMDGTKVKIELKPAVRTSTMSGYGMLTCSRS